MALTAIVHRSSSASSHMLGAVVAIFVGSACTESRRMDATPMDSVLAPTAATPLNSTVPPIVDEPAPAGEVDEPDASAPEPPVPTTEASAVSKAPSRLSPAERFLREERQQRRPAADDDLRLCGEQNSASTGLSVALCNAGGGAHADSGWVDFYQLDVRPSGTRIKAQLLHVDGASGFGNSGDVASLDLGADVPGFLIRGSYGNQGERYESLIIVALRRGAWKVVARLERLVDNDGSNDCAAHPDHCVRLDFTVTAKPGPAPRDLEAALIGTRGHRRIAERHVLHFDRGRGVYPVPTSLQVAP